LVNKAFIDEINCLPVYPASLARRDIFWCSSLALPVTCSRRFFGRAGVRRSNPLLNGIISIKQRLPRRSNNKRGRLTMTKQANMTTIKICGIKTLKDALAAIDAGADYLGFNFYAKSARFIEKETCAEITLVLKKEYPSIKLVGVFVNSSVDEVKNILGVCSLDLAQLHGDETPGIFAQLAPRVFKAFRGIPSDVTGYERNDVPAMLIDAAVKGVYGGSGVTADWSAAAELAKRYPLLLAGGLTPENVGAAIGQVKPWGVDTASGVESGAGEKDAAKMKAFVRAVQSESSD
jgi:phosphoribosylanthranilate isomerase